MYEYVRRPGGLGASKNSHEYVPVPGGLGWMPTFTSYGQTFRGPSCQTPDGPGTVICGLTRESTFMTNQGCRPMTIDTEQGGSTRLCFTGTGPTTEDNAGTVWCCPPGRPGTAETAGRTTVTQPGASRADIRDLQAWLQSINCSVGPHGVDGVWGPDTAAAVRCAEAKGNATVIAANYPWVATMRRTPTGEARPADFTFQPPVVGAKTPEDVAAGRTIIPGGRVASTGTTPGAPSVQPAGVVPGGMPWWGWMGLLGGVGALALVGLYLYRKGEEEDVLREEAELAALGY